MHNSLFLFQNKCLQKNNPPFTKKVATKQYTDSTVVLVRGLNLRLIRRLAPARMAIRYIPARLELQLLSPRLLAPTLAYGHYQVTGMQHVWLLAGKICRNFKKIWAPGAPSGPAPWRSCATPRHGRSATETKSIFRPCPEGLKS